MAKHGKTIHGAARQQDEDEAGTCGLHDFMAGGTPAQAGTARFLGAMC